MNAHDMVIEATLTPLQRAELELGKRAIDFTMRTAMHPEANETTVAADLAHRRAALTYAIEALRSYVQGKDDAPLADIDDLLKATIRVSGVPA